MAILGKATQFEIVEIQNFITLLSIGDGSHRVDAEIWSAAVREATLVRVEHSLHIEANFPSRYVSTLILRLSIVFTSMWVVISNSFFRWVLKLQLASTFEVGRADQGGYNPGLLSKA